MRLFGPSLFRRFLATTIAVVVVMAGVLLAYFLVPVPNSDWIESDMVLFARALDAIADSPDVERAQEAASKVQALYMEAAVAKHQPGELQYAIYRNNRNSSPN